MIYGPTVVLAIVVVLLGIVVVKQGKAIARLERRVLMLRAQRDRARRRAGITLEVSVPAQGGGGIAPGVRIVPAHTTESARARLDEVGTS